MAVHDSVRNSLLQRLDPYDLQQLLPLLELVDLPRRMILEDSGREITHAYFLESGLCSVVVNNDDVRAEAGHIGFEGATGSALMHGTSIPDAESFMQIGGSGWRIAAGDLLKACETIPDLRLLLLLFAQSLTTQITHSLLAAAKFKIQQRLARWLLMCHDRTRGDSMELTHEFLALMLAVRRASVTMEIQMLEGEGYIKAIRGNITILDRAGLIELSGGCYGIPEREYGRLFADFP